MSAREQRARERAAAAGQTHLFAGWATLGEAERAALLGEIEQVDFELVTRHRELLTSTVSNAAPPRLEPPEVFRLERTGALDAEAQAARRTGAEALRAGKVGYLVVAGGQASRLGYDGPKGCFAIGPVSSCSLFEFHARRLLAAQRRHGARTPWYVMTSRANDAPTREFFEQNRWFGLDARDVMFFSQAMVPALDFEGRILMSSPASLFLAPNGHGGTLSAFAASGALADARVRGLDHLSYFQVDNPLARPADELFIGLHREGRASMSSKVVEKRDAHEKVGVLGRIDGRMGCIEYSDLPPSLREARDARGRLRYGAGNIALHVIDVEFVARLTQGELRLPWHLARKQMSVWEGGRRIEVQGAKFEMFVFDALQLAERSLVLEVDRKLEFSPVKNATGEDSPHTTRADLCGMFAQWVSAAKLPLPAADAHGVHPVEIDPLIAEDLATFLARGALAPVITPRGHLYR
jgi:UDP-N-acetylglucosamine/UDP-N-acetylgalactosamine diphosphorylase